jgi:apolipoprotein N-acyltransferase
MLALLGGASLAVAFAWDGAWSMVFVALVALVSSLESSASRGQALFCGALFGWAAYVGGYHWMQPTLVLFWGGRVALSWAVWLAWGAVVTLRFAVVAWAYYALRQHRVGMVGSLTLPWVTVEWLYPSLFPFYLANTLVDQRVLAQAAALGGPLLLSAWISAVGAILARTILWLRRVHPPPRFEYGALLLASVALVTYGSLSIRSVEQRAANAPTIKVGIVQANVDVVEKRTERLLSHRRYAEQSKNLEAQTPVDLLIWPETSYLRALPGELPMSGTAVRAGLQASLLFGGIRTGTEAGHQARFNSAMLADADGMIRSAYDKRFLIPFAEFVPFGDRFASWGRLAPSLSHFRPGDGSQALQLGRWKIATPICYETIRPAYVRRLVRRTSPHFLVSLTNDGWFGDSAEPRLHLKLARLRAIEHRRYLVRATNTGISAVVDPTGRLVAQSGLFEVASLVHSVPMLQEPTLYEALGDWPGYLAVMGLVLLWVLRGRRARP